MIKLLTAILVTIIFTSCAQNSTEKYNEQTSSSSITVDTLAIAILPYDTTCYWIFKNCKQADLTTKELIEIETILIKFINDYNPKQLKQFEKINKAHPEFKLDKKHFIIDLDGYKRQYISVINRNGEKEVWINFMCDTGDGDWRKELIVVDDGGNCYFKLKINITKGNHYDFFVNGDA